MTTGLVSPPTAAFGTLPRHTTSTPLSTVPILSDRDLLPLLNQGLVTPWDEQHLGPCSLDLHLGDQLLIEAMGWEEFMPYDMTIKPYLLAPGEFVLAATKEVVTMRDDHCGEIALRSTAARMGLDHHLAAYVDAGFQGTITLELHNAKRYSGIELRPGMRLAQLIVHRLSSPVQRSYRATGNYNGQTLPRASNGNL